MAFAGMASGNHHTVRAVREGAQDKGRVKATRAHHADQAYIRCIFHTGSPGQIRGAITAPVAGEADNCRFKFFSHTVHSLHASRLEGAEQQTIDLGYDLLIAKACAVDRAGRAGCHTGATSLTERRVDLRDHAVLEERAGIERAHPVTNPAARTNLLIHACLDRLEGDLLLEDLIQYAR